MNKQIAKDQDPHDAAEFERAMANLATIRANFEETGRGKLVYYLQ